jgi:hypothetical protein
LTLSFEDGGYRDETTNPVDYDLADITPDTLPSVRNIVSDVMLDIPYYLTPGYHDKMVRAVTREANRIYQLWCTNNPTFASGGGRVHLVAHSLGSVMALDILSSQPTHVELPAAVETLPPDRLPAHHFAFDVHNLFLAGSPAGFFLLLKRAALLPRRGVDKPGARDLSGDGDEPGTPGPVSGGGLAPGLRVTGERGAYGCLPVRNLYNVINPYDPVAYCLNAAVDAAYAAGLRRAWVPSAARPWLPGLLGGGAAAATAPAALPPTLAAAAAAASTTAGSRTSRPGPTPAPAAAAVAMDESSSAGGTPRLPSTVELETHDFPREEAAERRSYLLNDNGQVDFFLRYGGGPLEIQYLTMLGAHSSYWLSRDFVRLLVVEIGRRDGWEGTVPAMRAVKRKGVGV